MKKKVFLFLALAVSTTLFPTSALAHGDDGHHRPERRSHHERAWQEHREDWERYDREWRERREDRAWREEQRERRREWYRWHEEHAELNRIHVQIGNLDIDL